MATKEQGPDALTPTERLALSPLTLSQLTQALKDVESALATAEEALLGAKNRKSELAAELKTRKEEKHREVMRLFCCSECKNNDVDQMTFLSPEGYGEYSMQANDTTVSVECQGSGNGDIVMHALVDGKVRMIKMLQLVSCDACDHRWPWPEDLILEWV